MRRLTPTDARFRWMSEVLGNDQFLLYCFAEQQVRINETAAELRGRARAVGELTVRILDVPASLDRPYWVHCPPADDQVVVYPGIDTWQGCLDRLAGLMSAQLDPTRAAWRVHLFGPIADPPRGVGPASVVVLQISHALADGRRASDLARQLFADDSSVVAVSLATSADASVLDRLPDPVLSGGVAALGLFRLPIDLTRGIIRGAAAYRSARTHPPVPVTGVPPTILNREPGPGRLLRTLVGPREMFPTTHPVTVGALTAISVALVRYLGAGPSKAELTVGNAVEANEHNNFRNVGIDLHTELDDLTARADAIAAEIDRARSAGGSPVRAAERRATDAAPALLTRWGIRHIDLTQRPATMTGVSVVSSVHRGPADLVLGSGPVVCTAGFPALSPAQGLTHGVHGIGDTVTLSVTTSPAIMPDVDRYVELLDTAIVEVRERVSRQFRGG